MVWITLPMAPACTSSPAFTAAFTSSRSLYMMAKMRLVSAMALRTAANCSSVVTPGLSLRKSLPCRITRTPSGARWLGIAELNTSLIEGSFRISSSDFATPSPVDSA
jgi:hypothetical protein